MPVGCVFPWLWRLHDIVAHTLTEVNVQAAAAAERLDPGEARTALERIEQTSHTAIGELRASLGVLRAPTRRRRPGRPPQDSTTSASSSPAPATAVSTSASTPTAQYPPGSRRQPHWPPTGSSRNRSPTPAVTRPVLPSPSTCASTPPAWPSPSTTAPAYPPTAPPAQPGVGITGMRERAEAIGGRLDAGPTTAGFHVQAELPYQPAR